MENKRFLIFLIAVITAFMSVNVFAARRTAPAKFSDSGFYINDKKYDVSPLIIEGTSYFPVRTVAYALNCTVDWKSDTKKIILTSQGEKVPQEDFLQNTDGVKTAIFDDEVAIYADGKYVPVSVAIVDDRSYIPIKKVAEAMGKRADWYPDERKVVIVNSQIADIDDSIKAYYIYDLPEPKSKEDYIIGNWFGYTNFNNGQTNKIQLFISKNTDGTFKIITKGTVEKCNENPEVVGNYYIEEELGRFDAETNILNIKTSEIIETEGSWTNIDGKWSLILKDGILYFNKGNNAASEGHYTRF